MNGQNEGKGAKISQGTCIKDPWTRTMEVGRIECGRGGWAGKGRAMGEK